MSDCDKCRELEHQELELRTALNTCTTDRDKHMENAAHFEMDVRTWKVRADVCAEIAEKIEAQLATAREALQCVIVNEFIDPQEWPKSDWDLIRAAATAGRG